MDIKKIVVIFLAVILVLVGLSVVKDIVIQKTVMMGASLVLGAPVSIDSFSMGILSQALKISGFKIYNPAGFPHGILLSIAKVDLRYDLASLVRGKVYLPYVQVDIREMGVLKNVKGRLNVDALKVAEQKEAGKPAKAMALRIDLLRLGIGRVVSKDYSLGGNEPVIKVYDVNLQKSYKNINSAGQLAALIVAEPMKAAGIQGAAIYGVATLASVAILPVAVAATFAGRDSVEQVFESSPDAVYAAALSVVKEMDKGAQEHKQLLSLKADVRGVKVSIKIKRTSGAKTHMVISARKYLLPQPEVAGGILYRVCEKVK